jgi:probable rRNA maturation factor
MFTGSLTHRLTMSYSTASKHARPFAVSLANEQSRHAVDAQGLVDAARAVLEESRFASAAVSLAVVDDATIHALNRRYLNHDWPTDVLSFVLEESGDHLEGEVIFSADTAAAAAVEIGWPAAAEQLLYVIHGVLHLVGYRDSSPGAAQRMHAAEARILRTFGCVPPPGRDNGHGGGTGIGSIPLPSGAKDL